MTNTVTQTLIETLDWSDRLALMDHYKMSPAQAVELFDVTEAEVEQALEEAKTGSIEVTTQIDVSRYAPLFAPKTATRVPKKRGRKGTKIAQAFQAITDTPVPVEDFLADHGISLAVLRQHKRFDKTDLPKVIVKKIRLKEGDTDKTLCVWRSESE